MTQPATVIPDQLRPINPTQDLLAIADLLENAFQLQNDPEAHLIIERMRQSTPWLPSAWGEGYVWESAGKIVGNLSLLPFYDGLKRIRLIANVAVQDEFRHRGIAKRLTMRAIHHCRAIGVQKIFLQVSHNNPIAQQLYHELNFHHLHSIAIWQLPANSNTPHQKPSSTTNEQIKPRPFSAWQTQKNWLQSNYPISTRWYNTVNIHEFSPWAWLNPFAWEQTCWTEHFTLYDNNQTQGILSWVHRPNQKQSLWLATSPTPNQTQDDQRVNILINKFLEDYWNRQALTLELPLGKHQKALQKLGFQLAHELDWMVYLP